MQMGHWHVACNLTATPVCPKQQHWLKQFSCTDQVAAAGRLLPV